MLPSGARDPTCSCGSLAWRLPAFCERTRFVALVAFAALAALACAWALSLECVMCAASPWALTNDLLHTLHVVTLRPPCPLYRFRLCCCCCCHLLCCWIEGEGAMAAAEADGDEKASIRFS